MIKGRTGKKKPADKKRGNCRISSSDPGKKDRKPPTHHHTPFSQNPAPKKKTATHQTAPNTQVSSWKDNRSAF